MTISPVDSAQFRAAMRLPATPVTVLATGLRGARTGLTASAVCSLSDSPPMILACVNLGSHALPAIRENRGFSANFLTSAQASVAEAFAGRTGLYGEDRFDPDWITGTTGLPLLSTALASFDCEMTEEYDSPTHAILIGRVVGLMRNDTERALVYSSGQFGHMTELEASPSKTSPGTGAALCLMPSSKTAAG